MNVINIPKEIEFDLIERDIVGEKEWALKVNVDGDIWVICSWGYKPKKIIVDNMKDVVIRSMEIYHKQLTVPPFNLKEVGEQNR